MDFLRKIFNGEDDEALFFIFVFFAVFIVNLFHSDYRRTDGDTGEMLFFIGLILMLLINMGLLGEE